jgi:hypothetical protein
MLNDDEAPPSREKFSLDSPAPTSYQKSFEMFRIYLTVFELFAESRFDHYRDAPSAENIFIRKPDLDFLLMVY